MWGGGVALGAAGASARGVTGVRGAAGVSAWWGGGGAW